MTVNALNLHVDMVLVSTDSWNLERFEIGSKELPPGLKEDCVIDTHNAKLG